MSERATTGRSERVWPKCECGRRFPTREQLARHRERDACLGKNEHTLLVRRLPK